MHISFRKISNGFLASMGHDYGIIGQNFGEIFYPSLEAMIGDADHLFQQAMRHDQESRQAQCIAKTDGAAQSMRIG